MLVVLSETVMRLDYLNALAEEIVAIRPYLIAVCLIKLGRVQQNLMADFTS